MRNYMVVLVFFLIVNGLLYSFFPDKTFSHFVGAGQNDLVYVQNGTIVDVGGFQYGNRLPSSVNSGNADIGGVTIIKFFDSLTTVWSYVVLFFDFILMPITIFISMDMPLLVQLIIGVPLAFVYVNSLVSLIRGTGD